MDSGTLQEAGIGIGKNNETVKPMPYHVMNAIPV
jgi:hypothetical protein